MSTDRELLSLLMALAVMVVFLRCDWRDNCSVDLSSCCIKIFIASGLAGHYYGDSYHTRQRILLSRLPFQGLAHTVADVSTKIYLIRVT